MTSKVSDIKAHIRRWGWVRTIYHVIMRGAADYLGVHVCVVRTRAMSANPQLPCTLRNIEYRIIEAHELIEASNDPDNELDRDFVSGAIDRGDLAFGAFDGDGLIAYIWRTVTSAPHANNLWVRVDQPYCYSYKSYTRPGYRGYRLVPSLMLFADAEMLKLGYTHRAGFIAITNFASLEVGKHMTSKVIGYGVFAEYFGRCFSFRSKAVAKIGFELFVPERGS